MLAYRRAPLRQSIVIWSCGPWQSPWRVASTTWPRPLQTCTLGVQWEGRGCVYVHIDTGVLMVVWYVFSTCQMLKCDHHISPWSPCAQLSGSRFSSENSWRSFDRTWGTPDCTIPPAPPGPSTWKGVWVTTPPWKMVSFGVAQDWVLVLFRVGLI